MKYYFGYGESFSWEIMKKVFGLGAEGGAERCGSDFITTLKHKPQTPNTIVGITRTRRGITKDRRQVHRRVIVL